MHPSYRLAGRFLNATFALLIGSASLGIVTANAEEHPVISRHDRDFTLKLPSKLVLALKKFNPGFTAWKTTDYSPPVIEDAVKSGNPHRAPFALVLDVNRDSVLDVVLDGHDEQNALLLCAFSDHGTFTVVAVEQQELVDPRTIETLDEGRKQHGLNHFLWPTQAHADDSSAPAFIVGYPQQSDSLGWLLNDGGMISYFFENGTFRREVEVP